jgi:hypothetical protein
VYAADVQGGPIISRHNLTLDKPGTYAACAYMAESSSDTAPEFMSATPFTVGYCKVPRLRNLSLTRARKRLKQAGCRLGRVTKPKHARSSRLVVRRQRVLKGRTLRYAAKVGVTLGRRH